LQVALHPCHSHSVEPDSFFFVEGDFDALLVIDLLLSTTVLSNCPPAPPLPIRPITCDGVYAADRTSGNLEICPLLAFSWLPALLTEQHHRGG
jgi:hypothetical protein